MGNGKAGFCLAGNILIDVASQAYIDDLGSAADSQDRFFGFHGQLQKRQLHGIPRHGYIAALGMCFLLQKEWMNVRAAGEEKAVAQQMCIRDRY